MMDRREFVTKVAMFGGTFVWPGEKWGWKKESPKEMRQLERLEGEQWNPVEFNDIKGGDRFRVVGEPGYVYGASKNAVAMPNDEESYIMVFIVEKT